MCAAPAGPVYYGPANAPPKRRKEFLFNKGKDGQNVEEVKVIVIHASFGDATLLEVKRKNDTAGTKRHYLVDGGPTSLPGGAKGQPVLAFQHVVEAFLKHTIKTPGQNIIKADGIMVTHPDSDHIEGVVSIFDQFPPNKDPVGGKPKFEFPGPLLLTEAFEQDYVEPYMRHFKDADFEMDNTFKSGDSINALEEEFELFYPLDKFPGTMYNYKNAIKPMKMQPRLLARSGERYTPDTSEPNKSSTLIIIKNPKANTEKEPLVSLNGDGVGSDVLQALDKRKPKVFKVPHHGSVHNSIPLVKFKPDDTNITIKLQAAEILLYIHKHKKEPDTHKTIIEDLQEKHAAILDTAINSRSKDKKKYGPPMTYDQLIQDMTQEFYNKLTTGRNAVTDVDRLLNNLVQRSDKIRDNIGKIESVDTITPNVFKDGVPALPDDFKMDKYNDVRREMIEEAKDSISKFYRKQEMVMKFFEILEKNVYVEKLTFLLIRAFYKSVGASNYFISSGTKHSHPTWEIINGIIAGAYDNNHNCRLLLTTSKLDRGKIAELNNNDPVTGAVRPGGILNNDWTAIVTLQYFKGDGATVVIPTEGGNPVLDGAEKWEITTSDTHLSDVIKRHSTADGALAYKKARLFSTGKFEITVSGKSNYWLRLVATPGGVPDPAISVGTKYELQVTRQGSVDRDRRGSRYIYFQVKLTQNNPLLPDVVVFLRPGLNPTGVYSNLIFVFDAKHKRKYLKVDDTTGAISTVSNPDDATFFDFNEVTPPGLPMKIMARTKGKKKKKDKKGKSKDKRKKDKTKVPPTVKPPPSKQTVQSNEQTDIIIGGPPGDDDIILVPDDPTDNDDDVVVVPGEPDPNDKSFDNYLDSLGVKDEDVDAFNMYDAMILLLQSNWNAYLIASSFAQKIIGAFLEQPIDEDETTVEFIPFPTGPIVLSANIVAEIPTSGINIDIGLNQELTLNKISVIFPDLSERKMYLSGTGKIGSVIVNINCSLPEPEELPEIKLSLTNTTNLTSITNLLQIGNINMPNFNVPLMSNSLGGIHITEAAVVFKQGAKGLQKTYLSNVEFGVSFTNLSSYLPSNFNILKTISSHVIIYQPLIPPVKIATKIDFEFEIPIPSKNSIPLTAQFSTIPVDTNDATTSYDITVSIEVKPDDDNDNNIGTGNSVSIADFLGAFGLRAAVTAAENIPFLNSLLQNVQLKRLILGMNDTSRSVTSFVLELYIYDWNIISDTVKISEASLVMFYINEKWTASIDATATFSDSYSVNFTFEYLGNNLPTKFSFTNYNTELTIDKFIKATGLGNFSDIPVLSQLLSIAITEVSLELATRPAPAAKTASSPRNASEIYINRGKLSLYAESLNIGSIFSLSQVDAKIGVIYNSSQRSYAVAFSVSGFINDKLYVSVEYDPNTAILSGTLSVASFKEANLLEVLQNIFNDTRLIDDNNVYKDISQSPSASVQFNFKYQNDYFGLRHLTVDLNKVFSLGQLSLERLRFEYQFLDPDPVAGTFYQRLYKLISVLNIGDKTLGAVLEFDLKASTPGNVVTASIKPTTENSLTLRSLLDVMNISSLPPVPEIDGEQNLPRFFDVSLTHGSVTLSIPLTEYHPYTIEAFTIHVETTNEVTIFDSPLIKLKKVSLKVDYVKDANPSTTAALIGVVTIGGIELTLQGTKEANGDTVFRLLATSEHDSTANLQQSISTLTPTGTTSPVIPTDIGIPKPLNVLVAELIVKYSPSNNENSVLFTGNAELDWPIDLGFQQFTVRQVGGKISYKKSTTSTTQSLPEYDVFVTGQLQFSDDILMSSELHFGGQNVDTVLSVLVADANQVQIGPVADDLLGFHDPQDSDNKTFTQLQPSHTEEFEPSELYININFTKKIFGLFGELRNSLGSCSLIAGDFSTNNTPNYGYVFGVSLLNFKFSNLLPTLREIDKILIVRRANCMIVSLRNAKVSDVVAKMKSVQETAVGGVSVDFPFTDITLDSFTNNQDLIPGLSIYCELNFNAVEEGNLFYSIVQISDEPNDVPNIIISSIISSEDARDCVFKAFISNLTLLGTLQFTDVNLVYQPSSETTFELSGKLAIDSSMEFMGQFTCSSTQSVFSVSTGQTHTITAPLGMAGITLNNVQLSLTYNYPKNQTRTASQSLSGTVNFYSNSSDISSPTATPSATLTGSIIFDNYSPTVVKLVLETDKPLTIADLVATIFTGSYDTVQFLNIGFVSGQLYYAKLDEDSTIVDGVTYNKGYHITADIEIFNKQFTIQGDIIPDNRKVSVKGFVKGGAIDLGFAKFTGVSDTNQIDESKSPEVSFSTSPTSTTLSLRIGLILLGFKLGIADIGFKREDGINKFFGTLQYNDKIGFLDKPSIGFEWSKENGFKVTDWPGSGKMSDAFDLFRKIQNYDKDGCKKLVNMAFKKGLESTFHINFGLSKTTDPQRFIAQIDITGTYDISLLGEVKMASIPIPDISVGIPRINDNEQDFTLEQLPQFILNTFTDNADEIVEQILHQPKRLAKIISLVVLKEVTKQVISSLACRKVDTDEFNSDANEDPEFEDPGEPDMEAANAEEEIFNEEALDFLSEAGELLAGETVAIGTTAGAAATAEVGADGAAAGFGAVAAGIAAFLAAIGLGVLLGFSSLKKKKEDAKKGQRRVNDNKNKKIIKEMEKLLDIKENPQATFNPPNGLSVEWNKIKYEGVNYHITVSGTSYNEHQQTATPITIYDDIISNTSITLTNDQFYNVVGLKVTVTGTCNGTAKTGEVKTYYGKKYSVDVTGVHPTLHSPSNLQITYHHSSRQISVTATPVAQAQTYYFELLDTYNTSDDGISTPLAHRSYNTQPGHTQIQFTFPQSAITESSVSPLKVRGQSIGKSGSSLASSPYVMSNTLELLPPPSELTFKIPHFIDDDQTIHLEWTLPETTTNITGFTGQIIDVNSNEVLLTKDFTQVTPSASLPKTGDFEMVHLQTIVKSLNYAYHDIVELTIRISSTSGNNQHMVDSVFISESINSLRSPNNVTAKFIPDTNNLQISWEFSQQTSIYGVEIWDYTNNRMVWSKKEEIHYDPDIEEHKVGKNYSLSDIAVLNDPAVEYSVQVIAVAYVDDIFDSFIHNTASTTLQVLSAPALNIFCYLTDDTVAVFFIPVANGSKYLAKFRKKNEDEIIHSVLLYGTYVTLPVSKFLDLFLNTDSIECSVQSLGEGSFISSAESTYSNTLSPLAHPTDLAFSFNEGSDSISVTATPVSGIQKYLVAFIVESNPTLIGNWVTKEITYPGNTIYASFSANDLRPSSGPKTWKLYIRSILTRNSYSELPSTKLYFDHDITILNNPSLNKLQYSNNILKFTLDGSVEDADHYRAHVYIIAYDYSVIKQFFKVLPSSQDITELSIDLAEEVPNWETILVGNNLSDIRAMVASGSSSPYKITSGFSNLINIPRTSPPSFLSCQYSATNDNLKVSFRTVAIPAGTTIKVVMSSVEGNKEIIKEIEAPSVNYQLTEVIFTGEEIRDEDEKEWTVSAQALSNFTSKKVIYNYNFHVLDTPHIQSASYDVSSTTMGINWQPVSNASKISITVGYETADEEHHTTTLAAHRLGAGITFTMKSSVSNWGEVSDTSSFSLILIAVGYDNGMYINSTPSESYNISPKFAFFTSSSETTLSLRWSRAYENRDIIITGADMSVNKTVEDAKYTDVPKRLLLYPKSDPDPDVTRGIFVTVDDETTDHHFRSVKYAHLQIQKIHETDMLGYSALATSFDDGLTALGANIVGVKRLVINYNDESVTRIKVGYRLSNGSQYNPLSHGNHGSNQVVIELEDQESIIAVTASTSSNTGVSRLVLITKKADGTYTKHGPYGTAIPNIGRDVPIRFSGNIISFKGRTNPEGLTNLGFHYTFITPTIVQNPLFGGGEGGIPFDHNTLIETPGVSHVTRVGLKYDSHCIVGFQPTYQLMNGLSSTPFQKGGQGYYFGLTELANVYFEEEEKLIGISGRTEHDERISDNDDDIIVTTLALTTQKSDGTVKEYGPYGKIKDNEGGTPFITRGIVHGFYGRAGWVIDALGVYSSLERSEIFGGPGGQAFDDTNQDTPIARIKALHVRYNGMKIKSIQASYIVANGTTWAGTKHGSNSPYSTLKTIEFEDGEDIVSMIVGKQKAYTSEQFTIGYIELVTQKKDGRRKEYERIYNTYQTNSNFRSEMEFNGRVVALTGRSSNNDLTALGIKYIPLPTQLNSTITLPDIKSIKFGGLYRGTAFNHKPLIPTASPIARISSLELQYDSRSIVSIKPVYEFENGSNFELDSKTGGDGYSETVETQNLVFQNGEILIGISERSEYDSRVGGKVITQLTAVTQTSEGIIQTYGPYGKSGTSGSEFTTWGKVVGFYGRSGNIINQLGVYCSLLRTDMYGSPSGERFSDDHGYYITVGIKSIKIRYSHKIHSIQTEYRVSKGLNWMAPVRGSDPYGNVVTYELEEGEDIVSIKMTMAGYVVGGIEFTTQKRDGTLKDYKRVGVESEGSRDIEIKGRVVLFIGRSQYNLNALGVKYIPLP